MTVRNAIEQDVPHLYELCVETGDNGKDATGLYSDPFLLGHYYAGPYFFHDRSLVFVIEDERGLAGYIVGTADTGAYDAWLETEWLPPLRKRYRPLYGSPDITETDKHGIGRLCSPRFANGFPKGYPAHLHIDLLPRARGQGGGRALMEAFLAALKEKHVEGVHLVVSLDNQGAIAFYQKTGFTVFKEGLFFYVMAQKIADAGA
jgi:ribosomal protein S18 acetylase RimI-like enzyme